MAMGATAAETLYYVNGVADETITALPTANTASVNLGPQGYGGSGYFAGSLARIRIFTFNASAFNSATDI